MQTKDPVIVKFDRKECRQNWAVLFSSLFTHVENHVRHVFARPMISRVFVTNG